MSRRTPRKRSCDTDMELLTKEIFNDSIGKAASICILGHVNPDGDCIGSTLAAYNYIRNARSGEDVSITVYLDDIKSSKFDFLKGRELISSDSNDGRSYDLAIVCDCADVKRLGRFDKYLERAAESLLIDHHFTNSGFGNFGIILGEASSTCEVLYDLLMPEYIDKSIAECIYTGIIHDTGVLRYSSTSKHTMDIAGSCMDMGIEFGRIVEESFFAMSFEQKQVLGYVLENIKKRADGQIVYGCLDLKTRKMLNAEEMDMDGIIDEIRTTTGALMGVFMYGTPDGHVKASLRSNSDAVDVSRVCTAHGGGGHKKAAGCFMSDDFEKNMDEIEADFHEQIRDAAKL